MPVYGTRSLPAFNIPAPAVESASAVDGVPRPAKRDPRLSAGGHLLYGVLSGTGTGTGVRWEGPAPVPHRRNVTAGPTRWQFEQFA